MMRTDYSPLLRGTIGFDRMMDLLDSAQRSDVPSYPPYNIEKTGDEDYRISMAVAGFADDELDVTVQENSLLIEGRKEKTEEESKGSSFLHRGIATRSFQRRFELADHIKVVGASLENGLLHIDLAREIPEAKKPRSIAIEAKTSNGKSRVIENRAA
jgi:molecular chaperone IbpA